jgi:hypothetical protein
MLLPCRLLTAVCPAPRRHRQRSTVARARLGQAMGRAQHPNPPRHLQPWERPAAPPVLDMTTRSAGHGPSARADGRWERAAATGETLAGHLQPPSQGTPTPRRRAFGARAIRARLSPPAAAGGRPRPPAAVRWLGLRHRRHFLQPGDGGEQPVDAPSTQAHPMCVDKREIRKCVAVSCEHPHKRRQHT